MAKENNLEIEVVNEEPGKGVSEEYLKINALGKVPTFRGSDGFVLRECIAIAVYCMSYLLQLQALSRPDIFPVRIRAI